MLKIMYCFYGFVIVCFGENFFRVEIFGFNKLSKVFVYFLFEWSVSENLVLK